MSAIELVARLRDLGWTVAAAESLTAGMVCSTVAEVPGCSDVLMGGVVAYQASVKTGVLRVPSLATGVVSREVAE
jgi:nicotinamide-nucleotide amidase